MDLPTVGTIPFLTRMDSPAYGQVHFSIEMDSSAQSACWPIATMAGLWPERLALWASQCWYGTHIKTDNRTRRQTLRQWDKEKHHNAPAAAMLNVACSSITVPTSVDIWHNKLTFWRVINLYYSYRNKSKGILDSVSRQAGIGKVDWLQRATVEEKFFPLIRNCDFSRQRPLIKVAREIKMCQVLSTAATQWLKQLSVQNRKHTHLLLTNAHNYSYVNTKYVTDKQHNLIFPSSSCNSHQSKWNKTYPYIFVTVCKTDKQAISTSVESGYM